MQEKADIGLIGLAVMGENLVLNMESRGFTVAVHNRTVEKVDEFLKGRAQGKKIIGLHSLPDSSIRQAPACTICSRTRSSTSSIAEP